MPPIPSICRIGVFYDGSYVAYARNYFYHERQLGWLRFQPFHELIERHISRTEQGHSDYRIVYAAWFQGMFTSKDATEKQLRVGRDDYHNLMHAGIEPKFMPMSQARKEKGIDVALTVDALQTGLDGKFDVAVLVTGDGDFVPLVRALMKQGIRVLAVHFTFQSEDGGKSFINERLLAAVNDGLDVNALETSEDHKDVFAGLFRKRT